MKNINSKLWLIVLALAFSCSKDDATPVKTFIEELLSGCQLTSSTYESYYMNELEYSDKITITYNENGYPTKYAGDNYEVTFSYNGDKVSKISFSYGADQVYTWEGDKISKYTEGEGDEIDEYRYEYSDNKLVKIVNWDNYSGDPGTFVEYGYQEITWSGDNVSSVEYFYNNDLGGRLEPKMKKNNFFSKEGRVDEFVTDGKSTYTYDDKINPIRFFSYLFANPVGMSANNVVKETYTYDTYSDTYTTSYEYNNDGYPVKSTDGDGDYEDINTYEYNCN